MTKVRFLIAALLAGAAVPLPAAPDATAVRKAAVLQHAKMIHANYSDCTAAAKQLQAAVEAFLSAPGPATLGSARQAWIAARQPYLESESYRFYAGPIDDPDGPEPLLNAWPLDESFIEAPPGSADPGMVGNTRAWPRFTPEGLAAANQAEGEKNIACGWHAVEFLLWGPDRSATGPGDRPWTDYTTAPWAKRRGELLRVMTGLIVSQMESLTAEWAPEELGNYRAVFEEGVDFSVERMVTALIFLSENEFAGERLQVAWDTRDQENEHSCFSDTTCQDNVFDALGMQNVWRGVYNSRRGAKLSGPGLREICLAVKPELEPGITALIDGNVAKAKAIPAPFDQAISGSEDTPGRKAVMALITSLEDTGVALRKLAQALDIKVPDVPPEEIEG